MTETEWKWGNVDFDLQRTQIAISSFAYAVSFGISFYLALDSCTDTFFWPSLITNVIAFVVPAWLYFGYKKRILIEKKDEINFDISNDWYYKVGKAVHVIVAVLATIYNAMALASAHYYEKICPDRKNDAQAIYWASIANIILYNLVAFIGHIMMRKPAESIQYKKLEAEDKLSALPSRQDLQRHRYRF